MESARGWEAGEEEKESLRLTTATYKLALSAEFSGAKVFTTRQWNWILWLCCFCDACFYSLPDDAAIKRGTISTSEFTASRKKAELQIEFAFIASDIPRDAPQSADLPIKDEATENRLNERDSIQRSVMKAHTWSDTRSARLIHEPTKFRWFSDVTYYVRRFYFRVLNAASCSLNESLMNGKQTRSRCRWFIRF